MTLHSCLILKTRAPLWCVWLGEIRRISPQLPFTSEKAISFAKLFLFPLMPGRKLSFQRHSELKGNNTFSLKSGFSSNVSTEIKIPFLHRIQRDMPFAYGDGFSLVDTQGRFIKGCHLSLKTNCPRFHWHKAPLTSTPLCRPENNWHSVEIQGNCKTLNILWNDYFGLNTTWLYRANDIRLRAPTSTVTLRELSKLHFLVSSDGCSAIW